MLGALSWSTMTYDVSAMHLQEKNEDYGGAVAAMENVLVWADRVLLPVINAER